MPLKTSKFLYLGHHAKLSRGSVFDNIKHSSTCRRTAFGAIYILSYMFDSHHLDVCLLPVTSSGNTFVLKPSEKDPTAAMMLADLAQQAGMPKGVINIVHGAHNTVNMICDHPDIKAVSFVGSDTAGRCAVCWLGCLSWDFFRSFHPNF